MPSPGGTCIATLSVVFMLLLQGLCVSPNRVFVLPAVVATLGF